MKLIYEKQVNGENKLFYSNENIPTETDIEILPEQIQKINEVMQELDQQLDPETEGTLANTVDSVVTEIGTDETEGSILGRISALESGGGGQSSGTLVYFTASKSDRVITPTSSANYTSQEIIDMIFNQKKPIRFGCFITNGDRLAYTEMNIYNCYTEPTTNTPHVDLDFVRSTYYNSKLYSIQNDGSIIISD